MGILDITSEQILTFINSKEKYTLAEINQKFTDFSKDELYDTLKCLKKKKLIKMLNYIDIFNSSGDLFKLEIQITYEGKAYLRQSEHAYKENKSTHFHQVINTIIATLALIVAILSYFKQ